MKRFLVFLAIVAAPSALGQTSPHGPMQRPCADCHTTSSWRMRADAAFDHAATKFPLTAQHAAVACRACHTDLKFSGASSSCRSCHTDVHRGELGSQCERCHDPRAWRVADMRQRHQQTRFPLVGAHAAATCEQCHRPSQGQQYAGTPITCVGCHQRDYAATTAPPHAASGLSTDCAQCHAVTSQRWGGSFDHGLTRFPLTGAHRAVQCLSCHTQNRFAGTSNQCRTCHAADYAATTSPSHAVAGFPQTCEQCHSTTAWQPSSFDHTTTGYTLTGAHRTVACSQCHAGGVFAGTGQTCITCHASTYASTTSPNHAAAGFPQTCQQCHTTTAWQPSSFDHATTPFALVGAHRAVVCTQCHVNNVYAGTSMECVACHQNVYTATTNPPHASLSFPTTCLTCHNMNGWTGASFNHAATRLPLTGAHATLACTACHVNNNYTLVYQDCYGCHQTDYAVSTRVNHATNQLSRACESCHTTTAWMPTTFNHDTQWFRILDSGKHRGRWSTCMNCHPSVGVYTSFTCLSCHPHSDKTETDGHHSGVNGYLYTSPSCYTCHRNV
jgi:hypothetical protein